MSELETNTLQLADAVKLLKVYGCTPRSGDDSLQEIARLKEALLLVVKESEWENLGICADNLEAGLTALQQYLNALGYSFDVSKNPAEVENAAESVYIKFNTRKMNYYADSYKGNSRGVLVAMQGDDEAILGTYGYFPLDLFAET